MAGDINNPGETDDEDDAVADAVADGDIVVDTDDDLIADSTAELKVDELVAKVDSEDADEVARQREVRQKLDALREDGDDEFGSTYNFNLDEDL